MDRIIAGEKFSCHSFGNDWLLLKAEQDIDKLKLAKIGESLFNKKIKGLIDVVCGLDEISLQVDHSFKIENLSKIIIPVEKNDSVLHNIEIEFDKGLDWARVEDHTHLGRENIIKNICSREFSFYMYGFLPGFIYLEGLPKMLSVPRRENVRSLVPAGSLGIGGNQIGIYSMPSPGGWNIIGASSQLLFNPKSEKHLSLKVGDKLRFRS